MAKLTKRRFLNLDPSQIGKMKVPELRELIRGARNLFLQQEKVFERNKEKVYSPALDKMRDFYEDRGKKAPSKMNMNQMRGEAFRLQEFFQADTSTVPGARKVLRDQSIRIFGTDSRGRPRYTPTVEQWTKIWKLFSEYKNLRPADVLEQSNIVQQAVGSVVIDAYKQGHDIDLSSAALQQIEERLNEERQRLNWEMDVDYGDSGVSSIKRPY